MRKAEHCRRASVQDDEKMVGCSFERRRMNVFVGRNLFRHFPTVGLKPDLQDAAGWANRGRSRAPSELAANH